MPSAAKRLSQVGVLSSIASSPRLSPTSTAAVSMSFGSFMSAPLLRRAGLGDGAIDDALRFRRRSDQRFDVEREQIADGSDGAVGRRIAGDVLRVEGVVALARKDGGEALAHDVLHRGEQALLVVDHHVAPRRIETLDLVEHLLFV